MKKLFLIILLSCTSFFFGQDFQTKPTISDSNPYIGNDIIINSGTINGLNACIANFQTGTTFFDIPDLRFYVLDKNDNVLDQQSINQGDNLVTVNCKWLNATKIKVEIYGLLRKVNSGGSWGLCGQPQYNIPYSTKKFEILQLYNVFKKPTPTDGVTLEQISSEISSPNGEATVTFSVKNKNNSGGGVTFYDWYKNDVLQYSNMSSSQEIKCSNTDKISVTFVNGSLDNCYLMSNKINIIPNITIVPEPPTLALAKNSCITGTINLKATYNNSYDAIQWATDKDFNSTITNLVTNKGVNLSYIITQPTTFYARTIFKDNYSIPSTITVTPLASPTYSSVAGNNQSVCGNTAIFYVNGANFDLIEWFSGPEATAAQLLSKTNPYNHNIANIPNGNNLKIYFRLRSSEGCYSQTNEVNYNDISNKGTVSTNSKLSYCVESDVDILLSSTSSTSFQWFEDQTMNIPVNPSLLRDNGSRLNYTTTATNIGTKTYWYRGLNSGGCATPLYSLIVTVKQKPSNLIVTNQNAKICKGKNIVFEVGANNAVSYVFYSNNLGSIPITNNVSNNTYTVNTTDKNSGNYSFWVKAISEDDCETELTQVNYTVLDLPTSLSVIGNKPNYCSLDTINVTPIATNASSYIWSYNNAFNNLVEASKINQGKLNYIPNTNESTNYWVKAVGINGCETTPIPVSINVSQRPIDVGITNNNTSVCFGNTISFAAFATYEDSFKFYSNASGTNQITSPQVQNNIVTFSSTNYTIGTNTFYFKAINNNGCETDLIKVTFNVLAQPTNLLFTGSTNYCTNDTVLITPSANNATNYIWAYDSNFNNLVEASKIDSQGKLNYLAKTPLGNFTYYVKANNSNGGCQTTPLNISILIKQGVTNLGISDNNAVVCQNKTISFTAGALNATNYFFFQNPDLTIPITAGVNGNIYSPNTSTTDLYSFWVVGSNNNGCQSQSLKVNYEIVDSPTNFTYFGKTAYCRGQQILITPSANKATKYIWAYDSNFNNLVESVNIDAQYRLNFTSSIIGKTTYYAKAVNSNGCSSETKKIEVENKIEPTGLILTDLNAGNTFCQGSIYSFSAAAVNASNYQWSKDIGFTDLVPSTMIGGTNANTLNINTSQLNIGQHTWYVRALNVSGCTTQEIKFAFNVVENVGTTSASIANSSICSGELLNISLSNNNTKTIYKWYLDLNGTAVNPIYISSSSSQLTIPANLFKNGPNVIYYMPYNQNCEGDFIPVNFTVLTSPTNLDVTNNGASVCKGKNIIFEASAINGNQFEFYKDANLLLPIDNSYINGAKGFRLTLPTSEYAVGTHTLYLIATSSQNCKTTPIAFTFTVNGIPGPTSLTGSATYCVNENIKFSLINSNSQKFSWFSDSNGLNPISSQYLSNDGATIVIPATSTELKMLYYRAINSSGCTGAIEEKSFSVLAAPTNISITNNSISYCSNDVIDIIAGANNATEFEWFIDSKATTLVDKAFLYGNLSERYRPVGLAPGNYSVWVRGKNIQGCFTEILQVNFVVRIKPIIKNINTLSNSSIFKIGDEIIFNIDGTNYDRYKILKNNTNFIPKNNSYLSGNISQFILTKNATFADEGVYKIVLSNGTCEEEKDFPIIIIPQDVVITNDKSSSITNDNGTTKLLLKNHESIQFTSTIANLKNYTFEWDYGDGFSNSVGKHFYNNTGEYSVSVKITNTVIKQSFIMKYALPIKIILDKKNIDFNPFEPIKEATSILYPNPVVDNINIKINNTGATYKGICRIFSYDGITVFLEKVLVQPGTNVFTFNNPLINHPTGAYIVKFYKGENDSDQFKVLKQ